MDEDEGLRLQLGLMCSSCLIVHRAHFRDQRSRPTGAGRVVEDLPSGEVPQEMWDVELNGLRIFQSTRNIS